MDVGMGDLHPQHCHANPLARNGRLNGLGNFTGKGPEPLVSGRIKIENVIILDIPWDQWPL